MAKAEPRRQQIVKLLEETPVLNISELADRFGVSVVTIRKDLDNLEADGLLQRTFGGATFSHRSRFNTSFLQPTRLPQLPNPALPAPAFDHINTPHTTTLH